MDLLDVVLHYDCNLECSYCTIGPDMRARPALEAATVARHIVQAAAAGCTAISLTGGEPTIRGELIPLIRHAKKHGFTDVKVQSNGLLFASAANLAKAIDAGLTRVGVSVHGYDGGDAEYERITGGPAGTQALMLRALDNLVASGVHLTTDHILMNGTLDGTLPGIRALHGRGVQSFNLWLVSLTDNNAANRASLRSVSEVAPVIRGCVDYGVEHDLDVRSLHVPRCMLPGYEACVAHPGAGQDVLVVTPEAAFQLSRSALSGGRKVSGCSTCIWDGECPGLREDYVAVFGEGEIAPVTGSGSR